MVPIGRCLAKKVKNQICVNLSTNFLKSESDRRHYFSNLNQLHDNTPIISQTAEHD